MTVTIQDLGYDILLELLELIAASSRTQLLECVLVCKSWREVAQPMLDRRVEFCLGPNSPQNDPKILARLEDEDFQARVHELVIGRFYWDSQRSGAFELHALAKLIKNMRLRKLIWKRLDPFPSSTWVETIKSQRNCEVHIRLETDDESFFSWTRGCYFRYLAPYLPALEPIASHLVTLQIAYFSPNRSATCLGRLLSGAGRLQSLYISTGHRNPNNDNYEWLSSPLPAPLNLRQLTLINLCACKPDTWDKWKNLVAWENLKEATFTCPYVIHKAGNRLHRLKKLQISAYDPLALVDLSQSHNDKVSIQEMLRMLGTGLEELRFCGHIEAFDPDCVSHLQSLRVLVLRNLVFPGERQQALQSLAMALSLSETNHPHLKKIMVQLPYSPLDVHQLDVPLSNIVGNLSYVDHVIVAIPYAVVGEDRTWDISPAERIWDHFESFPSRFDPGGSSAFMAALRPSVQTIEIRVVLEVAWTCRGDMICHQVEVSRRWKIRRLPPASTISIEPIALKKDTWKNSHLDHGSYHFQSGLVSFFAQTYPELDQFMGVQYASAGDLVGYLTAQRRAAGIQANAS